MWQSVKNVKGSDYFYFMAPWRCSKNLLPVRCVTRRQKLPMNAPRHFEWILLFIHKRSSWSLFWLVWQVKIFKSWFNHLEAQFQHDEPDSHSCKWLHMCPFCAVWECRSGQVFECDCGFWRTIQTTQCLHILIVLWVLLFEWSCEDPSCCVIKFPLREQHQV